MLQKTRAIQDLNCLTDRFDNPFVDDVFLRASEGLFTRGALHCVETDGYLLPYELLRDAGTLGIPVARFLSHGSSPIGGAFWNPDGRHERQETAFHAALDQLADAARADVLLWPYFPLQARELGWIDSWLSKRLGLSSDRSQIVMARQHSRAFLNCSSGAVGEEDGGLHVSRNKRKTTQRQWRRLADLGEVTFESTRDGLGPDDAIEAFFRVEASGWKASAGTALAVEPGLSAFARTVFPQMIARERAQIDLMMLNGHCISGLVSFRSGRGLFTWKTGMDDVYRRYSPGVQILLEASHQAISDPDIDYIDSLADSGHMVAEHIWAGRRSLALLFIPLSTFGMVASHGLRGAYVARDSARYWAKRALGRV
nr:GNAT family N-acetyltransferase [uncultured Cohaesibacter sp.]